MEVSLPLTSMKK